MKEQTNFKPGDLVVSEQNGKPIYGRVLHIMQRWDEAPLVVCDWYFTSSRKGLVWRQGVASPLLSKEG